MIVYLILKSSVLLAFGEAGYGAFREATKKELIGVTSKIQI
jgi:hypothetical protein